MTASNVSRVESVVERVWAVVAPLDVLSLFRLSRALLGVL